MQIIPAIDLKNGKGVRLKQGRKSDVTIYADDPIATAMTFAEAGVDLIHVVDLDGAFGDSHGMNRDILKRMVKSVGVGIEFGGGIRSAADVDELQQIGVARVVIGTLAAESPDTLRSLIERFKDFIAVGIDAREGCVMTRGWQQAGFDDARKLAQQVASVGVSRIVYTDITRDGMLTGPNVEQTVAVARAARVKVTASGGVSSLDDLRRLAAIDEPLVDSVIVGKALYENRFTLVEALNFSEVAEHK